MTKNKGEMLNKMLVLMANRHSGQFDKSGMPYSLHCLKVMHYTKSDDEEIQIIALGHDIIEDTDTTWTELIDMGFSGRVIDAIDALTKRRGESYDEYKVRVKANKDARIVKKADLRHNSDLRRLKGLTEKDFTRMEKYHSFYAELEMMDRDANG